MQWQHEGKLAVNEFWNGKAGSNPQTLTDVLWIITLLTKKNKTLKAFGGHWAVVPDKCERFYSENTGKLLIFENVVERCLTKRSMTVTVTNSLVCNRYSSEKVGRFALLKSNNNSRNPRYFKFTAGGKHFRIRLWNAKQVRRKITFLISLNERMDKMRTEQLAYKHFKFLNRKQIGFQQKEIISDN